ncbi:hypothetical protein HK102_011490, partial [Quaeritorhiza haematococci]
MCAAVGHNIMVSADKGATAFWFIMTYDDADKVKEFLQKRDHSIYSEDYFCPMEELANAPFTVYVLEQHVGDMVIIPPLCAHQVMNKGSTNIKVAWNRMTVSSLELCVSTVLPNYKQHFRPEVYRINAMIHYTLQAMTTELAQLTHRPSRKNRKSNASETSSESGESAKNSPLAPSFSSSSSSSSLNGSAKKTNPIVALRLPQQQKLARLAQLKKDFKIIIDLFWKIVDDEYISDALYRKRGKIPYVGMESGEPPAIMCDVCRADIWNRGYHCMDCDE